MPDLLIENGLIINEGRSFVGYIRTRGERIAEISEGVYNKEFYGNRIDASGKLVMPGVIDDQVHFREPGLTYKADIQTESIAAVAGGVTSFMEMPNTKPPTTSLDLLEQKFELGYEKSLANFSFYMGATNDNLAEVKRIDPGTVCGIKVFMGSSTGNMLVDDEKALSALFAESPSIIAAHCESEEIIRRNSEEFRVKYGENTAPYMHPLIRSAEACYRSSARAVELADRYGADLHILHLSTERELALFDSKPLSEKKVTNEICVHHLWFSDKDYSVKGNLIKWNPAVKTASDRHALRDALRTGRGDMIATDHAPHTLEEKLRPYWDCPSGGPLVQHSLVAMLEMAADGVFTIPEIVEKMCHAPAVRFRVKERGFLRIGAFADIVIVDPNSHWTVGPENILSKCGWSPFEGEKFRTRICRTIVNGHTVYNEGNIDTGYRGQRLLFER